MCNQDDLTTKVLGNAMKYTSLARAGSVGWIAREIAQGRTTRSGGSNKGEKNKIKIKGTYSDSLQRLLKE